MQSSATDLNDAMMKTYSAIILQAADTGQTQTRLLLLKTE
jgi:hypothetical protein